MNTEKLDALMDALPQMGLPHGELWIAKDGKPVYHRTADNGDAAAVGKDLYWIFSATKVITCIAAMRLVERGQLALADPVAKYLPEFAELFVQRQDGTRVPAQGPLTVEHLFTMTGGYSYDLRAPSVVRAAKETPSTRGIVGAMGAMPLLFEPGTRFAYGLCHDILAAVVEVAAGKRFSAYLEEELFRPLGITDMGFRPTAAQQERFLPMYDYRNGTNTALPRPLGNVFRLSEDYESGGAGLFATAKDYIKILAAVANGGRSAEGYVLLQPQTVAMMGENRLCNDARNDFISTRLYGYGWGLCGRAHMAPAVSLSPSSVGEFGWDGAAGAYALMDGENRLALYFGTHVMSCSFAYHQLHPQLRNLAYECILGKKGPYA